MRLVDSVSVSISRMAVSKRSMRRVSERNSHETEEGAEAEEDEEEGAEYEEHLDFLGRDVQLVGLRHAELNGARGRVVSWVAENSMSKGISFFPSEGEWYVLGFVSDRRDAWAMARAELLVHPEALSAERVDDVKARLRVMQGERDGDGFSALAKQLATAALAGEAESSEGDAALLSELTAQMSANVCGDSASISGPWDQRAVDGRPRRLRGL